MRHDKSFMAIVVVQCYGELLVLGFAKINVMQRDEVGGVCCHIIDSMASELYLN